MRLGKRIEATLYGTGNQDAEDGRHCRDTRERPGPEGDIPHEGEPVHRRLRLTRPVLPLTNLQKQQSRKKQSMTDSTSTASEFYDDATDNFPKVSHLAPSVPPKFGEGRLVAIWVTGEGKRKNDEGEFYPYVETVTVTLDDGPDGALSGPGWDPEAEDLVGPGVNRLDKFQHSTGGLVARLTKRLTGKDKNGVPLRFRPMVGRLNTQPSKKNKNVPAYSIRPCTEAERAIVERHGDMIRAINKELETGETTGGDPDTQAFDS